MDGIEEEERADAVVEIIRSAAEGVEGLTFGENLVNGETVAQGVQRQITLVSAAGDDGDKTAHVDEPPPIPANSRSARSSINWDSTSPRSGPFRASASWAMSRP